MNHLSHTLGEYIEEQSAFWRNLFGIRFDPRKGLHIPPQPNHADMLILIPAEKLLLFTLITHMQKVVKVESLLEHRDVIELMGRERQNRNYGIWCVRSAEPDHMQVSAEGFKQEYGKKGFFRAMNLTERLAFGLQFMGRECRWPDTGTITLCASTETHLGNPPSVEQREGRLFINIHHPGHKEPKMGVRGVFIA